MLFDWFTVVAQIINFLVLVFILHRLLYRPIVNAMEEREESVAARFEEAEEKEQAAEEEAQAYRRKHAQLDERRAELLNEAEEEAEQRRKELVKRSREEVEERQKRWRAAVEDEKDEFLRELRRRAGTEFYALARRALADLADAELEAQAIQAFLRRIRDLDEESWQTALASAHDAGEAITVQSAFELDDEQRQRIQETLHAHAPSQPKLHFATRPDLIVGIELKARSQVVAWHLEEYLRMLEERTREVLADHEEKAMQDEAKDQGGERDEPKSQTA